MMRLSPSNVWETLEPPRYVTVLVIVMYLGSLVAGATSLLAQGEPAVMDVLAAMFLIAGGAFGIPTAWTGQTKLETAAAFSCAWGMILLTALIGFSPHPPIPWPWGAYVVILTIVAVCAFFTRWLRIKDVVERKETLEDEVKLVIAKQEFTQARG